MVKKYEWYPGDNAKAPFKRKLPKPTKLRKSIAPGQVLIILAGRYKGKMRTWPGAILFLSFVGFGNFLLKGALALSPGYHSYFLTII
jgi:hypothetical protein